MAPLAELSVNRPGKTHQISHNETSTFSSKQQPRVLPGETTAGFLSNPSSINSMLKNTTELGDIGQFPTKSTRVLRQRSSTIANPQFHKHNSLRRQYFGLSRRSHERQRQYRQTQHRHGETLSHYYQTKNLDWVRSRPSDVLEQRSDSLAHSYMNSYSLSLRPSVPNLSQHDPASISIRCRSPFGHPSNLRYPGYFPPSPAYSEVNRSDTALHRSVHRVYSTRTASPLSSIFYGPYAPGWSYGINRSEPMLYHHPARPLSKKHDGNRSPVFSRIPVAKCPPVTSQRVVHSSQVPSVSDPSKTSDKSLSPPPLFYDYSEAFEKESFLRTAQRSSLYASQPGSANDTISEGYQTDITNSSNSYTKQSSSSSDVKEETPEKAIGKVKRPSPLRYISKGLKHEKPDPNKGATSENADTLEIRAPPAEQPRSTMGSQEHRQLPSSRTLFSEVSSKDKTLKHPFALPILGHACLTSPPAVYDPSPKVSKIASNRMRLSTSSSGSLYSVSSISQQEQSSMSSALKVPEISHERQPKALSVSFSRLDTIRHEAGPALQPRAASLDARLRPESWHIYAPVPGRSMSSRDSRDRFSRILSISDDTSGQDLLIKNPPVRKSQMTMQQSLPDKESQSSITNIASTHEKMATSNLPPASSRKGKEKESLTAVENNKELWERHHSEGLSNQDADAYSIIGLEHLAAPNDLMRPGITPRMSSVSRNSRLDVSGPSHARRSLTPLSFDLGVSATGPRKFPLTLRNSSLLSTMKELPPLPADSIVSVPPPATPASPALPFAFTPLVSEEHFDTAVADIDDDFALRNATEVQIEGEKQTLTQKFKVKLKSDRCSTASPPSSRPWNLDTSYPWNTTPPILEVGLPQPTKEPELADGKLPQFKLKVHRASKAVGGTKLTKSRPPKIAIARTPKTSEDMGSILARSSTVVDQRHPTSPTISLVPPSPGLNIEAQSFFSDDSSQLRPKGSLRKHLSQIKVMAANVASSDDTRGGDRGLFSLVLGRNQTSRRNSKQSVAFSKSESHVKSLKGRLVEKFKSWIHHSQQKVKAWRGKIVA